MSTKALNREDIQAMKERVRWSIGYICDNCDMTNEKIGKDMGCATSTINSYRRMITLPGMDFSAYMKKYNFSSDWLDSGRGEPFPGAREKYKEVCGPEGFNGVRERMDNYNSKEKQPAPTNPQEFRISDALTMCTRVLESGTSYATALYFNIEHFDRAVKNESNQSKYIDDLQTMNESLSKMQTRMDEVEKDNKKLKEELKTMQGLSGDSAPIALSVDHAAPTGTEDQET